MTVAEVAAMFRVYMDEPDKTFVNDAQLSTWLASAYDDFRSIVTEMDPHIYLRQQVYSLSNARTLDLATSAPAILGSTAAAGTRLYQLVNIYTIESTTQPNNIVASLEPSLSVTSTYDSRSNYTLQGTQLTFPEAVTMDIRIDYIPEPNINWAGLGASYIDDLNRFHDIIALLAYLQYAIVDVAPNNELNGQLARRIEQLRSYLEGRAGGIVERVVDVRWM
ncbi:MAG: hypothetical protein Unbinned5179contig1001_43 [Prokaryotic dsDNA virus sp.]|nr:MAG: hypothetical protein Unbinned5179contig1001_43 [Prokaryotic dsDNA virus sp.]|tara:strand:+ start:18252 stop:18914 length:663 start_codon:yes stop_codon:yes gene_type:complete